MNQEVKANMKDVKALRQIFENHKDKRILVLGGTCVGKTTLVKSMSDCLDQDEVCWAMLPKELEEKLLGGPWSSEMVQSWNDHVENAIKIVNIKPGQPLFGGSLFRSDLIVHLNVDESTLRKRAEKRNVTFEDAQKSSEEMKEKLKTIDIPIIAIDISDE